MKTILLLAPGCSGHKLLEIYSSMADNLVILGRKKYEKKFNYILNQTSKPLKNLTVIYTNGLLHYINLAKILAKKADLIIAQDPFSAFSGVHSKRKNQRMIFMMCQNFLEYLHASNFNFFIKLILDPIYKFLLHKSCRNSEVIVLSSHIKKFSEKFGAKNVKIIPVYGVNTKVFSPKMSNIKKKFNIKGELLFTAARFSPEKGLIYLLNAFKIVLKKHPNLKLILAGNGILKNDLIEKINSLNLKKNIILSDRIDHKEIPAYYNACDIFVLPSLKEGLGFVCAEALSCEKPVIASNTGGIPDMVINNKTGILVKPGDSLELSNAISKLLNNSSLRKKLGKQGRAHVLKHFDEAKVIKRFKDFIKE